MFWCFAFLGGIFRSFTRAQNKTTANDAIVQLDIHIICLGNLKKGHHWIPIPVLFEAIKISSDRISSYFFLLGSHMGFLTGVCVQGRIPKHLPVFTWFDGIWHKTTSSTSLFWRSSSLLFQKIGAKKATNAMSHWNPDPPFISCSVRYSGPLRFLDDAAGVCYLLRGTDLLATSSQHFDEVPRCHQLTGAPSEPPLKKCLKIHG